MLPVLIEQVRHTTQRRIHGPVPERRRPVRGAFAGALVRAARRLDPAAVAAPRPQPRARRT